MIKHKYKNKLYLGDSVSNDLDYDFETTTSQPKKQQRDSGFNNVKNNHSFNSTMMRLAYKNKNKVVSVGDKMYVSGTSNARDVWDDVSKVPNWNHDNMTSNALGKVAGNFAGGLATGFVGETTGNPGLATMAGGYVGKKANEKTQELTKNLGDTTKTERYGQATKELNKSPGKIKQVVGDSLGGSIALELEKNNPELKTTTYGAPVFQPFSSEQGNRYRHQGDIVSAFDSGAKTMGGGSLNPIKNHSFKGYNGVASSSGNTLID
jgi:outer membrane lipoprotein SlyB